jgi:hypothetical protein
MLLNVSPPTTEIGPLALQVFMERCKGTIWHSSDAFVGHHPCSLPAYMLDDEERHFHTVYRYCLHRDA